MNIKNARFTVPSVMLMSGITILAGCMNGVYTVDSKIDYDDGKTGGLNYEVLTDSSQSFKDLTFREDTIPIFVKEEKSGSRDDHAGLMLLWGLTLGVFPYYRSSTVQYTVSVQSPVGTKDTTYSVNTRDWTGWFPCLIPVPGWGVERIYGKETDRETRDRIAGEIHDKVVKALVGEFSKDEYATYVKSVEDQRAKEAERVKQRVAEIEGLMTAGKFEEAITACRDERTKTGKEEPWKGLVEKGIGGLRDSVQTIKDVTRLVSVFTLTDDVELKGAVVLRLGSLKEVKSLPADALNKIVAESSKNDVKIAAIQGIKNDSVLLSIAEKKYGDDVVSAAFSMISEREHVRNAVWAREVDVAMARVYINTFASDDEFGKLIEKYPSKLTPEFVSQIKSKTASPMIRAGLSALASKIAVEKITSEFDPYKGGKYNPRWFSFRKIVAALSKVTDKELRADVALQVLRKGMEIAAPYDSEKYRRDIEAAREGGDNQKLQKVVDQYMSARRSHSAIVVYEDEQAAIFKFCEFLRQKDCEQIYDEMTLGSLSSAFTMEAGYFAEAIIGRLSGKALEERVKAASARAENSGRIVFEGFYCGMPYKDYLLMAGYRKVHPMCGTVVPERWYSYHGAMVDVLTFKRKVRYVLCNAEDGEFWPLFMRKYIPQKTKSLGEAIGDALDKGSFDYQEVYDEKLEERCYVYKSLKYKTRITYGLKSGTLRIEPDGMETGE